MKILAKHLFILSTTFYWLANVATHPAVAGEQRSVVRDQLLEYSARVESVNLQDRVVVLVRPSGERAEFSVDPQVRNLDHVKPGDSVVLRYYAGLAAQIKPKGTAAKGQQDKVLAKNAPSGTRPAVSLARSSSATVTIESVDKSFNTVTFKRADGITRTVAVDSPKGQELLQKLKPGDAVEITYTEAVAVSVEPGLT